MRTDRSRRCRLPEFAIVATLATVLALIGIAPPADATPGSPEFTPMPCPDGVFPDDLQVDCGFIRVPEDRTKPGSRTITVAAAVVRSQSTHKQPDPIVFLDGGPSFPAINSFAMDLYFAGASYIEDRDVILVDTRGTGLSSPNLGCPELDEAWVQSFYAGSYVNSQASTILGRALHECRSRLEAGHVNLSAYNSAEGATDLEALRRALGVTRWNLLAISADGVLGLTYMRMFPNGIRSAVLDSAMSTQQLWGLDFDRGLVEELDSVFKGCEQDSDCRATYPGIRNRFYDLVDRLNRHPVLIRVPDMQPVPVNLLIDGAGLLTDASSSIFPGNTFEPEHIHDLLELVWSQTHGGLVEEYQAAVGTGPIENDHANDVLAMGKTMSYVCRDLVAFITPQDIRRAIQATPAYARRYRGHYDLGDGWSNPFSPDGCSNWGVGRAAAVQHQPVTSAIPTLVLAGEFDTGVTPNIVRQIPLTLSQSTYVEFPASSHLQLASYIPTSDCARMIAAAFLDRPTRRPSTACVRDLPPFDYGAFPAPTQATSSIGNGRRQTNSGMTSRANASTWALPAPGQPHTR